MDGLKKLYRAWSGEEPDRVEQLAGAGSNRVYYRLTAPAASSEVTSETSSEVSSKASSEVLDSENTSESGAAVHSVIGCVGTSREENHAFITLSRHFAAKNLPVPEILAVSDDELRYLQTDLGSTSLFDALKKGREAGGQYDETEIRLLEDTIRLLPRLQIRGAEGLDWSVCYPQPSFDAQNVMFDLNYFKYCFLKATEIDFHELKLEADFRQMAADLTATSLTSSEFSETNADWGFMYRDFQARNVMLREGIPFFIDFQGGRRGPIYYDLASFLWQASARYSDDLRRHLLNVYYEELKQYKNVPAREEFDHQLTLFVLFRTLQVLGAYGFRGYFERKQHFIASIPPAKENLRKLLKNSTVCDAYPYLKAVLLQLCDEGETSCETISKSSEPTIEAIPKPTEAPEKKSLVVRVFSFSYKKGIPEDESGNGGGYVFDCRSTHNPGRYEPYKQLTGLDEPVIRFLEDDGEITTFLESVYKLADTHVERYLERGFTSLMFSFGCTGGQHRSVYSAQHLAEHLHQKFGIEVHLCHREQGIFKVLNS